MSNVALGTPLSRSLISSLASDCGTAAALARFIAERPGGTIDSSSVAFASRSALANVAADFVRRSWLTVSLTGWHVGPLSIPQGVVLFLEGAAAMRSNDPDKETSTAVVTMPPFPSAIASALSQTGLAYASLVSTRDALISVAEKAVGDFTVMTPFLNQDGLGFVLELFELTRANTKRLIVRQMGEARRTVIDNASQLVALGISSFDYTLDVSGGFETFHAKVALADSELAYVGSANMTVFARHSMELGVLVEGRAARVIANVIRAVTRVAHPIPLA
jgi:phosphatidylserine/phosphatidylglycerophosphate/cardiolipin synthase-like enzyme